jgi:hypothetical protein
LANTLYPSFKQLLLGGDIDLANDDIRIILIDTADYTYSAAHDFLDDVAAGSRVATSSALASKTITNGVFDAADKTITAVTGDQFEAIIIYKHTGTEGTSPLIAYLDSGYDFPKTPDGGDMLIQFPADANKIFSLS